jgi:NhaC family Na+:H+ antiporter
MGMALIPVLFLVAFLFYATMVNNVWETGWIDVHIPLLLSAFVAGLVAIFGLNYEWAELEEGIVELIKASMGAIIILMIIGVVIGTWLASGIVPAMIYYGLKILNPAIFLVVTLIMCSIVSLATGSSWTTGSWYCWCGLIRSYSSYDLYNWSFLHYISSCIRCFRYEICSW